MIGFLFQSLPYLLAISLAVLIPVGAIVGSSLTRRLDSTRRMQIIFLLIGAGSILSVVMVPRNLNQEEALLNTIGYQDLQGGFLSGRLFNFILVGVSITWALDGFLVRRKAAGVQNLNALVVAAVMYLIGTTVVQAVGSDYPAWTYKSLYVPVIMLAVFHLSGAQLSSVAQAAKWVVVTVCVASLVAAGVKPDFALNSPFVGFIPGITSRLFGVTQHANSLGPIALVGLVLEYFHPARRAMIRMIILVPLLMCFLLAQSKTAWIAAMLIACSVVVPGYFAAWRRQGRTEAALVALLACIAAGLVIGGWLAVFNFDAFMRKYASLSSFSGRSEIWEITLAQWEANPLFGYGPSLWSPEFRFQHGMLHVGQAHNQFIHTLGEAGGVGLALLLMYMAVLLRAVLALGSEARRLPLCLFMVILARCFSESPLRGAVVLEWAFFTHLLLFAVLLINRDDPAASVHYVSPRYAT